MKVAKIKIDKRGRITLPRTFLDANNIIEGQYGFIEIINGSYSSVRLTFEAKEGTE
tara:strand:+ start:279 stop:446 length:168 start_codon:yes stop_codon:yes gene_type:complete